MFSRSFFGTIGVVCNYYSVDHMLLSDATMLNKMSPFFSALFAVWILKEKITWVHVSFLGVALAGCAFILKPGVEGLLSPAAIVALMGGLCAGIAYTEVRKLGTGGVDKNWIILFFSTFSCICALPFLIFDYVPMTGTQLIFLLLAGLTATGGQFGVTAAYCYVAAAEISIYDYSQIIFAALFGYLFFAQIPDLYSVVGYIIVCAAAIGMAMYSEKRNQKIEQNGREIRECKRFRNRRTDHDRSIKFTYSRNGKNRNDDTSDRGREPGGYSSGSQSKDADNLFRTSDRCGIIRGRDRVDRK